MPNEPTSITPAAGCLMQLIALPLFAAGVGILGLGFTGDPPGSILWGTLMSAGAVWLFRLGRRPAVVGRSSHQQVHGHPTQASVTATPIEHYITAKGGSLTYRVIAHRQLSDAEAQQLILEALQDGRLQEPPPGQTATLVV